MLEYDPPRGRLRKLAHDVEHVACWAFVAIVIIGYSMNRDRRLKREAKCAFCSLALSRTQMEFDFDAPPVAGKRVRDTV